MFNKDAVLAKVNKVAQFMAKQTHFRAMRDAFAMVVPFMVLTGFVILFNYVLINPEGFMSKFIDPQTLIKTQLIGNKVMSGTMSILALLILVLVSYSLSMTRKVKNAIIPVVVSVSCMFVLMPTSFIHIADGAEIVISGAIQYSLIGAGGMFVAIITGILATELFIKLSSIQKLQIKIGGNIPPAVAQTFNSLTSVILTILVFALASFLAITLTGYEINDIIVKIIQTPLVHLTTSLPGFLILSGMAYVLFFFGIHPGGIINPILEPPLLVAMQQNVEAFTAGGVIPNIIVLPFRDLYGHIGGTGSTIALLIVIFIMTKRAEHKTFAKMVIPTSIFNINEPIIFGFPILFNPFMFIPFVFGPLISFVIAYFATYFHLVGPIITFVPWAVPPIISGYLGSGGDLRNVLLQLVLLAIQVLVYIPFLKLYERSLIIADEQRIAEAGK
jgi:PTS system cellobiose-specific IIC component